VAGFPNDMCVAEKSRTIFARPAFARKVCMRPGHHR